MRSALTERSTLLQTLTLPVNYLIMLSLLVLSGSNAPTAVVMNDAGPYAQKLYTAMDQSRSYHLVVETQQQAQNQFSQGTLVTVVTIPSNFDEAVTKGQQIRIPVQINNLNEDLTGDAERGLGLSITTFYASSFPSLVSILTREHHQYQQDTDYIPFLAISIMVISLLVTGLLQAGMAAAREWEQGTIKEVLLSPSSQVALLLGKVLSAFVIGLPSVIVVLAVVVFIAGDWPHNFVMVIGVSLLSLLVFATAGVALGMALKDRNTVTTLTRAVAVPLFFLSGVFGPISYSTPIIQDVARVFPVHYAITLEQYAFKQFVMTTLPVWDNILILCEYLLLFVLFAGIALRWSKIAH